MHKVCAAEKQGPAAAPANGAGALVAWRAWPARKAPRALLLPAAALLFSGSAAWQLFHNPTAVIITALLLTASWADFLLPTRYAVTPGWISSSRAGKRLCVPLAEHVRYTFRGNLLLLGRHGFPRPLIVCRLAPAGEPGDRASIESALGAHAAACRDFDGR